MTAAKKAKKEVATVDDEQFPTTAPDYMNADSTRGQENVGMEDLTIPRLDVIQDLSPQHKENKPEYIEGAKVGMLFNSVTKELYDDSVFFVPVFFRKEWVIWKDRKAGGGFAGAFPSEAEANTALAELEDPDKHDINDTAQQFGLVIRDDGSTESIVISMAKSKMKTSRQLNTMCNIAGGDRFSRVYKVSATEEQNKEGQDYWGLGVSQLGFVPEDVYHKAEKLYDEISKGTRDVNRKADDESTKDESEAEY